MLSSQQELVLDNRFHSPALVSVITTAFNAAGTLGRAHESLKNGGYSAWEHIIVDDGSTDSTGAIAAALMAEDSRVKAFTTINRGTGAAINHGFRFASGEFIAFLDADDEYLPGHLTKRVDFLESHPSVDILWGGLEMVLDHPDDAYVPDLESSGLIHVNDCAAQGTFLLRRSVLEGFSYTEDRTIWYSDYDFFQRATTVHAAARFREATYRYYRNSGSSVMDRVKAEFLRTRTV